MKIEALKINDFKKLSELNINAQRGIVILGGKNGAGKTSALDAIQLALCGTSTMPKAPIREGADKAVIEVDLGDVTVKRTITRKDDGSHGGSLTVVTKDGLKPGAAQTWLNQRIGDLTMDPLAFMNADPKARAAQLRKLCGVDTTELDNQRKAIEAARRDIGRDGAAEKARLDAMPYHEDAPAEPVQPTVESASEIMAELDKARASKAAHDEAEAALCRVQSRQAGNEEETQHTTSRINQLRAELAEAEARRDALADERKRIEAEGREAAQAAHDAEKCVIDEAPIRERLAGVDARNSEARARADEANAKLRANQSRAEQEARTTELRERYKAHTAELAAIDQRRAEMLASAAFPVVGLGFNEDGDVTFNGVPLDQASGAERMRVSMAMALAANPTIRVVLVRDASLLDEDSMAIVAEMAEKADAQVWLERVGSADPGAVVIVDGAA